LLLLLSLKLLLIEVGLLSCSLFSSELVLLSLVTRRGRTKHYGMLYDVARKKPMEEREREREGMFLKQLDATARSSSFSTRRSARELKNKSGLG
jgi:hypothetical protein